MKLLRFIPVLIAGFILVVGSQFSSAQNNPSQKSLDETLADQTPAPEVIQTTPASVPSTRLWNLQDADILSIINEVSKETGKNFIVDPRVSGKISLVSS